MKFIAEGCILIKLRLALFSPKRHLVEVESPPCRIRCNCCCSILIYNRPLLQLSLKFGVDFDNINRAILRATNNGASGYCDPSASKDTCFRHEATTITPSKVDGVTPSKVDVGNIKWACSVFLTYQEGVRLKGDGNAGPGQDEECLVLRFAVGGNVSLVSAWPMVVERTRELMKTELGHIHFCNCFS